MKNLLYILIDSLIKIIKKVIYYVVISVFKKWQQ